MTSIHIAGGLAAAIALAAASATPAAAKIRCNGPYQIVSGQQIATPYCEDAYLARVARDYGTRVSAAEIRHNPNKKREVCHFIGRDIRLTSICAPYIDSGRRW